MKHAATVAIVALVAIVLPLASCASAPSAGDPKIADFFTDPKPMETGDGRTVITIFRNSIDNADASTLAEVLYIGFLYASKYAVSGDHLGVAIMFKDGARILYVVDLETFLAYVDGRISAEAFLGEIERVLIEE